MNVLIVESNPNLGSLWIRSLTRCGMKATLATTQSEAIAHIFETDFKTIILDLVLSDGCAFAISDFANYRRPEARIIFVTNTSFFSDGSIFQHSANACAFVQSDTNPDDLAALVHHYAEGQRPRRAS